MTHHCKQCLAEIPADRLYCDAHGTTLTDGSPVTKEAKKVGADGMQAGYVVLSAEERAQGFVRPVRLEYVHVGIRPKYPTRPLTDAERETYKGSNYVAYEKYPESESPLVGRMWTQKQLDSGCNDKTRMNRAIAETYARDPKFYGGTYCSHCGTHFRVGEHGEFVWLGTDERVGT